jgi:hypothetical protein
MGCSLISHQEQEKASLASLIHRRHRGLKIVNQPAGSGLLDTLKLTPVERERKCSKERERIKTKQNSIQFLHPPLSRAKPLIQHPSNIWSSSSSSFSYNIKKLSLLYNTGRIL